MREVISFSVGINAFIYIEGQVRLPKRMNFGKLPKGEWSFSIQKFILQILDLYIGLFSGVSQRQVCVVVPIPM